MYYGGGLHLLVRLASFSSAALFLPLKRQKLQCVSFEAVDK